MLLSTLDRQWTEPQRSATGLALLALCLIPRSAIGTQESAGLRHDEELPVATLAEVFELDMTDAPLTGRARHLVEAPDGSVFLAGAGTTSVLRFDPEGAYRGEIGREGEGPGEFRLVTGLGIHGDTLWVADAVSRRVSRFLPDASLLEAITVPRSVAPMPSFLMFARDGSVVGYPMTFMRPGAPGGSGVTSWWHWPAAEGSEAGAADTLITIETGAMMNVAVAGRIAPLPQPFAEREPVAFGGTEPYALTVRATREDDDGLIAVERLHFNGERDVAVAVRYRPRRLTPEEVDRVVQRIGRGLSAPVGAREPAERATPEIAARVRDAIHTPDFHPPLTDLFQGTEGAIWIGREATAGRRDWLIAQDGAGPTARINLADYQSPLSAGAGYVWLMEPAAFDLQRIVKYRLETS